jgi:hypothetical protein
MQAFKGPHSSSDKQRKKEKKRDPQPTAGILEFG